VVIVGNPCESARFSSRADLASQTYRYVLFVNFCWVGLLERCVKTIDVPRANDSTATWGVVDIKTP